MEPIASYLRSYRRKSGFSLHELAQILGSVSAAQISRHERSLSVPGLLAALGYETVFQVPISELFPGLYGTIKAGIEEHLAGLEDDLGMRTAKGREAASIASRLEWLTERKNAESI
jgi:transcriptional regulator with XRE-family HTH domain